MLKNISFRPMSEVVAEEAREFRDKGISMDKAWYILNNIYMSYPTKQVKQYFLETKNNWNVSNTYDGFLHIHHIKAMKIRENHSSMRPLSVYLTINKTKTFLGKIVTILLYLSITVGSIVAIGRTRIAAYFKLS